eukprot:1154765-Pelagomonas_calceolata.AAC.1
MAALLSLSRGSFKSSMVPTASKTGEKLANINTAHRTHSSPLSVSSSAIIQGPLCLHLHGLLGLQNPPLPLPLPHGDPTYHTGSITPCKIIVFEGHGVSADT